MLHRSLKTPDLWDLKNRRGERSGGVFGFMKSINASLSVFDGFPIICWDAGHSFRRLEVYPNYKHHLDKAISRKADKYALMLLMKEIENLPSDVTIEERQAVDDAIKRLNETYTKHGTYHDPDDYSDQYLRQRDITISICHSLGIPSVLISHWEGDDLITIISRIANKSLIVTDDKDMIQLISPDIEIFRVMAKQHLIFEKYMQETGAVSAREFVIAKAISGDPSDNIPSVTKNETERKFFVGEATAKKIARIIADNNENAELYTKILLEQEKDKNKMASFVRNLSVYERNMKLVDLSLVESDLSVINQIIAEIHKHAGKSKLFDVISKLSSLDITSVDVNSMIARLAYLKTFCFV